MQLSSLTPACQVRLNHSVLALVTHSAIEFAVTPFDVVIVTLLLSTSGVSHISGPAATVCIHRRPDSFA
jgi:hypothetical protein